MKDGQPAPYGSWQSPITSDLIVSGGIGLELVGLDEDTVYWTEARPTEAGRVVIVQRTSNGATSDVIPPPFNARTRVHEYGGGAVLVAAGVVFFSNFTDQQALPCPPRRGAAAAHEGGRDALCRRRPGWSEKPPDLRA